MKIMISGLITLQVTCQKILGLWPIINSISLLNLQRCNKRENNESSMWMSVSPFWELSGMCLTPQLTLSDYQGCLRQGFSPASFMNSSKTTSTRLDYDQVGLWSGAFDLCAKDYLSAETIGCLCMWWKYTFWRAMLFKMKRHVFIVID